jgi:hypothetical protein
LDTFLKAEAFIQLIQNRAGLEMSTEQATELHAKQTPPKRLRKTTNEAVAGFCAEHCGANAHAATIEEVAVAINRAKSTIAETEAWKAHMAGRKQAKLDEGRAGGEVYQRSEEFLNKRPDNGWQDEPPSPVDQVEKKDEIETIVRAACSDQRQALNKLNPKGWDELFEHLQEMGIDDILGREPADRNQIIRCEVQNWLEERQQDIRWRRASR